MSFPEALAPWTTSFMGLFTLAGGANTAGLLGPAFGERWILGMAVGHISLVTPAPWRLQTTPGNIPLILSGAWAPGHFIPCCIRLPAGNTDVLFANLGTAGAQQVTLYILFADTPRNVLSPLNLSPLGGVAI